MIKINDIVWEALKNKKPVVALESAVISFGLPQPYNLKAALHCEKIIWEKGATPATIGIIKGTLIVGLRDEEMHLLATERDCIKTNLSNLGGVMATEKTGATTVAATMFAAYKAGIKIMSTGGIGGVHPGFGKRLDISSDLLALSRFPLFVICAGPKSLLDITATREALETLGIPVIGFKTNYLPAFYLHQTNLAVDAVAGSPAEIVAIAHEHWQLGFNTAVLVVQPVPEELAVAEGVLSSALAKAEKVAQQQKIEERQLTPFILKQLAELTEGATLRANLALLEKNASLASEIASAFTHSAILN